MISELLGLPKEHWPQLKAWSTVLAETLELYPTTAMRKNFEKVTEEFCEYLQAQLDHATLDDSTPLGSYLKTLIKGGGLSASKVIYTTIFLFASGHETLSSLIGNGVLALSDSPGQWQKLQAQPELLPNAIEELLRFDSPVQIILQVAGEDIQVEKQIIPQGEQVILLIGSANHDGKIFNAPDKLNITRDPNPHLAFGSGIHKCIGAKLARQVATIAFSDLLKLFPLKIQHDKIKRKPAIILRRLGALWVLKSCLC